MSPLQAPRSPAGRPVTADQAGPPGTGTHHVPGPGYDPNTRNTALNTEPDSLPPDVNRTQRPAQGPVLR